MSNATYIATNFQMCRDGLGNPRSAATASNNPGPWAPLNKEIAMCILKTWREHCDRLIKQRLRLL